MDKFTKWFEWTKRNKDLTQNGMLLINVLMEKWDYHKHQPFHYSIKWLGEQIKVKKDDTVLKALNNLIELNLITITKKYENSNKGKNYYSINEETVNKLSGIADTSMPPANKKTAITSKDEFNKYLLTVFDKNREALLKGGVEFKNKLCDDLSTKEAINLLGSKNNFNANYYQQFRLWYQKQNGLKSQTT